MGGWLCHRSNCRELAFALQASRNGNPDAQCLYRDFRAEVEEVRDKALARGSKATALKTAVAAGASSSSQEPRFDKRHEAKAKATAKGKAKSSADRKVIEKALQLKCGIG